MKAKVGLVMLALFVAPAARTGLLSTVDSVEIDAFQAGRTVVGFDELVIGTSPCFIVLDPTQYASLGIEIRAESDGSPRLLHGFVKSTLTLQHPRIKRMELRQWLAARLL